MNKVIVIGAGLAGCECALQLANHKIFVDLYEMKPEKYSPAHHSPNYAELVCSNSFKSDTLDFATGVLKAEMRLLDSEILKCADLTRIPTGKTLTVDRERFSELVTQRVNNNPFITVINQEVTQFDTSLPVVIATGPLCSDALTNFLSNLIGEKLYFYDAVAPIVSGESIDMSRAVIKEDGYIDCSMSRSEYETFCNELKDAKRVDLHNFEKEVNFEACLPIEIMAKRGLEVMRCGPLKPSREDKTSYASVQLRKENVEGSMYNLVGFQTNLLFEEQKRVFSMIPALKNAEWLRYGVMHRNTYINATKYLNRYFQPKSKPNLFFAGQISGVEGYIESVASGLLCAINVLQYICSLPMIDFGTETCLGALQNYLECGNPNHFEPMHINWGLLKPINATKAEKKTALAKRALDTIQLKKETLWKN